MLGGLFRVLLSVAKSIWIKLGVDENNSRKGFGIETVS